MRTLTSYGLLLALGLFGYGALAGDRLWRPSHAPHFVVQAEAWLRGQAHIDPPWPGDDWAKVETVERRAMPASTQGDLGAQGTSPTLERGRRLHTRPSFRTTDGRELPLDQLGPSRGVTGYVSFPPAPTLLMVPSALLGGRGGSDVWPTVLVAALILPLAAAALRRLAEAGLSARTPGEDRWLVVALGFGTVLCYSAVGGRVWYTAHVLGVALALAYLWAAIEARRPMLAGLALGLAALTRTPMAFMFPLLVLEAWRMAGGRARWATGAERTAMARQLAGVLARFAAPVVALAIAALAYNHARFGDGLEFGHSYLDVRQQAQIEQWGLFDHRYLARNLAVALTLLPELSDQAPYVRIGGHGLALWVTSPFLVLALWPRQKSPIGLALGVTALATALPSLFYQNSGWVQFGYRFSLDYIVFLIALLAVGARPLTRLAKGLIAVAVVVNLFGALTFERAPAHYRTGGDAYDVVVRH